jgi:hypothetical protein
MPSSISQSPFSSFAVRPSTREVDENLAHQPCGHRKKMCPILPGDIFPVDQTHERFIDERGGLQHMSRPFALQIMPRQPPELRLDQGYQLFQRRRVSPAPRHEELGDLRRRRVVEFG